MANLSIYPIVFANSEEGSIDISISNNGYIIKMIKFEESGNSAIANDILGLKLHDSVYLALSYKTNDWSKSRITSLNPASNTIIFSDIVVEPSIVGSQARLRSQINGQYRLYRKCIDGSEDNTSRLLCTFNLPNNNFIYSDRFVEPGAKYVYWFEEKYSDGSTGGKSKEVAVVADLDHLFLSDANKQLKVKFNPKVSSIKTIVPETKIETIGSKYPFFFRNGAVEYKEIPLSGLIAMEMDEQGWFSSRAQANEEVRPGTNTQNREILSSAQLIRQEREFKMQVESWLRNGQPKLFRSGPEGMYAVRLMNISLSPNDTLGRRLHTFQATGYEIDSANNLMTKYLTSTKTYGDNNSQTAKNHSLKNGQDIVITDYNQGQTFQIMADGHDIVSFDSITFTQTTAIANGNIATQNQPIDLKGATVLRFTVYDPIGSITIKYQTEG